MNPFGPLQPPPPACSRPPDRSEYGQEKQVLSSSTSIDKPDRFDLRARQTSLGRVSRYNAANQENPEVRARERFLLIERLELQPGMKICDVTAGGGYLALGIEEYLGGNCEITCTENSPGFFASLPARFNPLQASMAKIGLASGSMDRVACLAGLHHLERKMDFFHEAFRLLKPGGLLAVADAQEATAPAMFLNGPVDRLSEFGHDGIFPQEGDLSRWMTEAGFEQVSESAEHYEWKFSDRAAMAQYCHTLFGLKKASVEEVGREIELHLPTFNRPGEAGFEWGLIFASGRKPG